MNDPSTEPIPDLPPLPPVNPSPAPAPAPKPPSPPTAAFDRSRFQFMSGIPAGEPAYIRAEDGNAVLSYRSFASIVSVVAALMTAVVLTAGLAGAVFLLMDHRPLPAIAAMMLSAAFAAMIVMLIPATNVTIFDGAAPAITIVQQSSVSFPSVTYVVALPDGKPIGRIAKSFFSRFGRNRWLLWSADDLSPAGEAVEESLSRALLRKALGKFAPAYQSNLRVRWNGEEAGWIIRRPDALGQADILNLNPSSNLDRRLAVAVAMLVLASEP